MSMWQKVGAMLNRMIQRADDFCQIALVANYSSSPLPSSIFDPLFSILDLPSSILHLLFSTSSILNLRLEFSSHWDNEE